MPTIADELLPAFIEPMLARAGDPFDSDEWLFEIKWDGFRAICLKDARGCRLVGRRKTDFSDQFSSLVDALCKLPHGTAIDGEIVALRSGKPDFTALLRRGRRQPGVTIVFIAFDLLYQDAASVMAEACQARRERLRKLVRAVKSPLIVMSEGVVGQGKAYFQQAAQMQLEGVMAKRLSSKYLPGKRTGDWVKIKQRLAMPCVVVGYEPSEEYGLRSLIVASTVEGELRCVGKVGSGIDPTTAQKLLKLLKERERRSPPMPCKMKGRWVEPDLFCRVSYAELLETGSLRAPVFEGMIDRT